MTDNPLRDALLPVDIPRDLAATGGVAVATSIAVRFDTVVPSVIRQILAWPLVLFFAGYALTSIVFPEREGENEAPSPAERLVLSIGFSVVVVPLVAFLVDVSPLPLAPDVVLHATAAVTAVTAAAAAIRRWRVPSERRFTVPIPSRGTVTRHFGGSGSARVDGVLNVVLALSLVFSAVAVGYAATRDPGPDPFTTVTVMTQNESGELVAAGYPAEINGSGDRPLHLVVDNREGRSIDYTIVVELRRQGNETDVAERTELNRTRIRVASNESRTITYEHDPSMAGRDLRLSYLVYRGGPPAVPTHENAYRSVSLRVNVSSRNSGA